MIVIQGLIMPEIKNLKKAAQRILRAIKKKEKIILYGDADLDGTCSVIILEDAIKNLGAGDIVVYFVDREKEGYGLNEKALNYLKKQAPALLIAMDLGITNFKEVKLAKKIGFETLIIDHHNIVNCIPEADIVVDPKQPGDKYGFKELAAAGVVYRLARILFKDKLPLFLNDSFLELTALATIADMMPRDQENKKYIEQGLESLKCSERLSIRIFLEMDFLADFSFENKVSKIISVLNISGVEDHKTGVYLLLTCQEEKQINFLIQNLLDKDKERRLRIRQATEDAEIRALKNSDIPIIFEGDRAWFNVLIGAIASRLCNKYEKPCFIFNKMRGKSVGAVRMPHGLNGVKAMESCSDLLMSFGGHPPAAGFTIKNKNLEKFKKCLIKYFKLK